MDLSGFSIVVDCAHGATAVTAPEVLERLGARVTTIGAEPDGMNINAGFGSTDLAAISDAVRSAGADLGLAFDGDGDRMLAVDEAGATVDGDQILAICALDLRRAGVLAGDAVVTTTMTNLGFRRAMAAEGIEVRWTDVGDRYVLEEMRQGGFVLGGEQSGHVINLSHGPSGDGLAAALHLLRALRDPRGAPVDGRRGHAAAAAAPGERARGAQGRPSRSRRRLGRRGRVPGRARRGRPRGRAGLGHGTARAGDGGGADGRGVRTMVP